MQSTSAESNVLNVSASLGKPVKALTKFVSKSPISAFIQGELRRRGIEFEGKAVSRRAPGEYGISLISQTAAMA
mgnify:CR=1 FL=1